MKVLPHCAALASFTALVWVSAADATHLHCGQVVTQSTRLDSDLVNCPGSGLVLEDGVRLDLAGHEVDGTGPGNDSVGLVLSDRSEVRNGTVGPRFDSPVEVRGDRNVVQGMAMAAGFVGMDVSGSHNLIRGNRTVPTSGGESGLTVGGTDNRVERNDLAGAHDFPLVVIGAGNQLARNTIRGGFPCGLGIIFNDIRGGSLTHNLVKDCIVGIGVNGQGVTMTHNVVTATGEAGVDFDAENGLLAHNAVTGTLAGDAIVVSGPGSTVKSNTADDNAELGIRAESGAIDGGGNRASGNGDPRQCVGVVCR